MSTDWKRRFGLFLSAWVVAVLSVTRALTLWDPLLLFLLTYVGFLLAVEQSEPAAGRPKWHRRMRWVSLLGLAVLAYVAINWLEQLVGAPIL